MKIPRRYLFLFTLLICTAATAQPVTTKDDATYDFNTTLRGGYSISFQTDDSLQYLYLKKGRRTIAQLSSMSKGLLNKNLGYIGADFNRYFVLVHSFGSGNPHYIELIKKVNGNNVLKNGAAWIDVDKKKQYLLYSRNDVPAKKDKMTLYNIRTGQQQFFYFPTDMLDEPEVLHRIKISKLTNKELVIRYESAKGFHTKIYCR